MEGDRGATLLIRAAAKSGIDFSKAQLLGRWWWLKIAWILAEIDKEGERDLLRIYHSQHIAAFDYQASPKSFKHHWALATKSLSQLYNSIYPWAKVHEMDIKDEAKAMADEWKARFGDPNDSKVKARIERTARMWAEMARQGVAMDGRIF